MNKTIVGKKKERKTRRQDKRRRAKLTGQERKILAVLERKKKLALYDLIKRPEVSSLLKHFNDGVIYIPAC